ncbi:MAG: anti-sigma factor, partial [Chloroflexota bacterium]
RAMPAKKETRTFPLAWAGIGALVLVGLAFAAFRFFQPAGTIALQPATPDPNQFVGRAVFSDQNGLADKITITFDDFPAPQAGTHYDVWLVSQGGEFIRKAGSVEKEDVANGQLVYTNADQENALSLFDQIEVTVEADNDPNPDDSSGDVIASSVFPPLALIHVRHVLVAFTTAPDRIALIQGLWASSDSLYTSTSELQEAYSQGDEELARKKIEEIINLTVGNANKDQYKDWNGDGIADDPSDGFGLLQNGDPGYTDQGYIAQTISHAQFAARAPDATGNIKTQSAYVVVCLQNMQGWSQQLLEKALLLQDMPFGPEMEPLITEMVSLAGKVVSGTDSNGNQLIEPVIGEGGATTAYEYAYYMAEMPILMGPHRIPPPAPTPTQSQ